MELFYGQPYTFMMLILVDYYLLTDQIFVYQPAKKSQSVIIVHNTFLYIV